MLSLRLDSPHTWSERFCVRGVCSAPTPGIIGLTGISGSGKTTLLRVLAGLELQSGTVPTHIEFSGTVWQSAEVCIPPEHRSIGMVFQQPELFPTMTVLQNIRFALPKQIPPMMQEKTEDALLDAIITMTHIGDFLRRKPHELSGGQQKRIALARALARCAPLLLLDEPTIGLDHASGERLMKDIIRHARAQGQTVVIATHDHYLLQDIDTVWHIVYGKVENGNLDKK